MKTTNNARTRFDTSFATRIVILLIAACSGSDQIVAQPIPSGAGGAIEVIVSAEDGVVRWDDVAQSVAKSLTLDQDSVRQMLPHGSIDLRSDAVTLMLVGIDLAFGDSVSIDIVRDSNRRPSLRLRCRRDAFGDVTSSTSLTETRLQIDSNWGATIQSRPLVVCIHGLKGDPSMFDPFRTKMRRHGFSTAVIRYDDSRSILDSSRTAARLIASRIRRLKTDGDRSQSEIPRVALVGHSMGGLIAREIVENRDLNRQMPAGTISHLFTVATPHSGSNWAALPPLLNMVNGETIAPEELVGVLLHQPSSQGLRDLKPGSAQLTRMAQRPRDPQVAYTNVVGTGSPIGQAEVAAIRDVLVQLDRDGSVFRLIRPRIKPLLGHFDELIRGKGDGVVSVENAKLQGVADVVKVPLAHGEMFRPISGPSHPVWDTILERLE